MIKRVFREANGIRLVSLNKKYSDQIIPLDEEPGVIGKVIGGFVPVSYTHLDVYKRQLFYNLIFGEIDKLFST